jgi:hypothetical protein
LLRGFWLERGLHPFSRGRGSSLPSLANGRFASNHRAAANDAGSLLEPRASVYHIF